LSDDGLVVLLAMSEDRPISRSRIQDLALVYGELFGDREEVSTHDAYIIVGYSDGVDESVTRLTDIGVLRYSIKGYLLSDYGAELQRYAIETLDDPVVDNVPKIISSLSGLSDRELIGLIFHLYRGVTRSSGLSDSVDRFNRTFRIGGRRLADIPTEHLEGMIREGTPIPAVSE
ncbi:MAG: hypothetical protein MJZ68_09900, partial [archaeon]|nr:hypothetical protein [archaeon]